MNKIILGAAIFSLAALANAQSVDVTVTATKDVATSEQITISADKSDVTIAKTNCITQTGSRIKSTGKKGCNGKPGRSYDKDDIDRTGALTVGEALERLDPSVRISR